MSYYLGIDTSNYTTSASIYDARSHEIIMQKKLLPVEKNAVGLRQSEAVFSHIKQLPDIMKELFKDKQYPLKAICVSKRPRNVEGSYMPAFLVGDTVASCLASVLNIPKYECSHQEGHIVAALYSANSLNLMKEKFYAFHVSGGTTECLLVSPNETLFDISLIAKTLDLNAGQLIDRVGVMLSLDFPCGKALTELALQSADKFKIKPTMKGLDIHLSGVQNQCEDMFHKGMSKQYIARYTIEYVKSAIDNMTNSIIKEYGKKPFVYAGGVMSNVIIKEHMEQKYHGLFAKPEFSTDNASGVAILGSMMDK